MNPQDAQCGAPVDTRHRWRTQSDALQEQHAPPVEEVEEALQLELACGGSSVFLPSASTVHSMRFTTRWEEVQHAAATCLQGQWVLHHARKKVEAIREERERMRLHLATKT